MDARVVIAVALTLILPGLAGCLGQLGPRSPLDPAGDGDPANNSSGAPDDPSTNRSSSGNGTGGNRSRGSGDDGGNETGGSGNETSGNGTDDGNQTSGNGTSPGWPSMSGASIRPGADIVAGACTANFVFSTPDNETLYIGTASHCVSGKSVGGNVKIAAKSAGVVAYCSWGTIKDQDRCPKQEQIDDAKEANDFALVRIKDGHRGDVHPAMRGFGGPTGIAASGQVGTGDHVLTYGNSGLRDLASAHDPREGYVLGSGAWITRAYFATPSVFGDSGSPVILADGGGLGVLSTIYVAPTPAANGVVNLDKAVRYMEDNTDLDVELKTWGLTSQPVLPG